MVQNILWDNAIFFFDVDDTLIDTAANSIKAADSIESFLSQNISSEKVTLIKNQFNKLFNTLACSHMTNGETKNDEELLYDALLKRIKFYQEPVIREYGGIKKWSREVLLQIASEDTGITLDSNTITKAVDKYWESISNNSFPFDGVIELINNVREHGRPIFLITSSDARLTMKEDGLFHYDPNRSQVFKRARLQKLNNNGISFDEISIGDPEDKPQIEFFDKGLLMAQNKLGKSLDTNNMIMFGDSFKNDLHTPLELLHFGLVVLFVKNQPETKEITEKYISTGNISTVTKYLT